MRERGESFVGTGFGATAGDGGAAGDGRVARTVDEANVDGERGACDGRRACGCGVVAMGDAGTFHVSTTRAGAAGSERERGLARFALRVCCKRGKRITFWIGAGVGGFADYFDACAEG